MNVFRNSLKKNSNVIDIVHNRMPKIILFYFLVNGNVELGVNFPVVVNEISRPLDGRRIIFIFFCIYKFCCVGSNETGMVSDLTLQDASMKRKAAGKRKKKNFSIFSFIYKIEVDGILSLPNHGTMEPITISGQYYSML